MATLTLKNFPDVLYAELKARAAERRRSLNQEAILCLEEALGSTAFDASAQKLAELQRARGRVQGLFLTDRALARARSTGRA